VARLIQKSLAKRVSAADAPIPLIAETGGQNVLIVDSSALTEQAVGDAIASAFDSAGQRCSALRVLCLQDDIADRTVKMLIAAMRELKVGPPDRLSTDVGPVISAEALDGLRRHVEAMRARGFPVHQLELRPDCASGHFLPPTIIEISSVGDLQREVFGPVLHVLRFKREAVNALIDAVNASGYALTGGAHSRIDATIDLVCSRLAAGNLYVNRNIIGAVVGAQPFGGHGLSGTGPKAGGPIYMKRLLSSAPASWPALPSGRASPSALAFAEALRRQGREELADLAEGLARASRLGLDVELPGPVGERNLYALRARGAVLCDAASEDALLAQIACALSSGNRALLSGAFAAKALAEFKGLPLANAESRSRFEAALTDRRDESLRHFASELASREGAIVSLHQVDLDTLRRGEAPTDLLLEERSLCINTTAAGGNASLMSIG
jgi:RHH-type proline utilization regulon transcriptional repressor/proline dehydrogenase/delta 1-pyrroline-5-carboxylate dehydrogenase